MSRFCFNNKPEIPTVVLSAIDGPFVIKSENYTKIESVHNSMVGHGGIERALRKLQDLKQIWKNVRLDVKTYVRECPCCQKTSQVKIPIIAYKYTTVALYGTYCTYIPYRSAPYGSCTKIPYSSSARYLQKHIVALVLCVASLALCSLSAQLVTNPPSHLACLPF